MTAANTIPQQLLLRAAQDGKRPAMRQKRLGVWRTWSWAEQAEEVRRIAFALGALGLARRERVAVVGDNVPELYWTIAAAQSVGAVPVPLFGDLSCDEVVERLARTGPAMVIAENQEQVDKVLGADDVAPGLRAIVYVDPRGMRGYADEDRIVSLRCAIERGRELEQRDANFVTAAIALGNGGDEAVVLHTAGAGGTSRAVVLTHRELLETAAASACALGITPNERTFALLPTSWFADHQSSYVQSYLLGYVVHCPEGRDTIPGDLREVAPTYVAWSPRIVEALLRSIESRLAVSSSWRRKLVQRALDTPRSWWSRHLVIAPLVEALGLSALRVAVVVGRALDAGVARRWARLGLPLSRGFGCTEAGGVLALLSGDGMVPTALPGFEVRFEGDELTFRRSGEAASAGNGWTSTGDLRVGTDLLCRRDELILLANGTAAAAEIIEWQLAARPEIRDAIALTDGRGGAAALIMPDPDFLAAWAVEHRIPYATAGDLSRDPELEAHFGGIVQSVNDALDRDGRSGWKLTRFALAFGVLGPSDYTPSGRPRRARVARRLSDVVATPCAPTPDARASLG
jgi:long-chain acyl-CoA synthetase